MGKASPCLKAYTGGEERGSHGCRVLESTGLTDRGVADTVVILFLLHLAHFLKHDDPGYPHMNFPSAQPMIYTVDTLFGWSKRDFVLRTID